MNVRNYTRVEENYSFCNCFWYCYSFQLFLQLYMLKFYGFGVWEIFQFILWRKGKILQDKLEVGNIKKQCKVKAMYLLRYIRRFWSWFATNINNLADTEKSYYGGTFFKCHMDKRKLWKLFPFHPSDKFNIFFSYNGLNLHQVLFYLTSIIYLMFSLSRLNIPLSYEAYAKKDFLQRYEKQCAQILGFLSHFVFSCLFRVSCLAFMWIYLAFYATIPILVLLFINILIFYILESDKGKFIDVEVFNLCYLKENFNLVLTT